MNATTVSLGELSVLIGRTSPLLLQASVPADTICVLVPLGSAKVRLNGFESQPGLVAIHGPGSMHLSASHESAAWAAIIASAAEMGRHLPRLRTRIGRERATCTLLTARSAWERAIALFKALDEVAASEPDIFDCDEARRSLRAQLLETVAELTEGAPDGRRARFLHPCRGMEHVIRAIDERMRESPAQVITGADLERDLAVPERRLRSAVRRAFGVGLSRYLLARRLLALRARAAHAGEDLATRRMLAAACGFWRLDDLEREYYALFQERFFPARIPACERAEPMSTR